MLSPLATDLGVQRLLVAAGQAPSVLNTQPWHFRLTRGESAELLADPERRLRVSDPRGRSMHVSCGAALFNLRLAARVAGYHPSVWLLPGGDADPTLMALVRMIESAPPTPAERRLHSAIPLRRTNRLPFDNRRVPPGVMAELRIAASREGANLVPLSHRATQEILEQVAIADDALAGDHAYLAELAAWTAGGFRFDGVPRHVQGPHPEKDPPPVRDLGMARPWVQRRSARFETRPQIAVLTTLGDRPVDWLRAGQALQRVLLTATAYGLSASFLNQPLDLRDMQHHTDPRHRRGHPQMIMRLGYGPDVPRAPRRPAVELLC